jgi:hypothetical protein
MESAVDSRRTPDQSQPADAADEFVAALLRDVKKLVTHGPAILSNPTAIPDLAELAFALEGASTTCRRAVVVTLNRALGRLTGFEDNLSGQEVAHALTELMGIGHGEWANQPDRFDNAADALWKYKSGASFRRTKRKDETTGKEKEVWKIFLDLLVAELVSSAEQNQYMATGRFRRTHKKDARELEAARALINELAEELAALIYDGYEIGNAVSDLACVIYPAECEEDDKIEALFTWAINNRFPGRSKSRQTELAILDFVGMGNYYDQPILERLRNTAPNLPYRVAEISDEEALRVARELSLELAVSILDLAREQDYYRDAEPLRLGPFCVIDICVK